MAVLNDPPRSPIPRWRDARTTAGLRGLTPQRVRVSARVVDLRHLAKARQAWEAHRTVSFAADFVGAAFAVGESAVAREAAEYLLTRRERVPEIAQVFARTVLDRGESHVLFAVNPIVESREKIRVLREYLRRYPYDPIRWVDLALEYVILGQTKVAHRPIEIALALAPDDRFVLRSAARFYLHVNDAQYAHHLLRDSSALGADPWILAGEIAVARVAGRESRHVKRAIGVLESGAFSPFAVSELASAVATLEFEHGKRKRMKAFFRQSLEDPTDNAVAQVAWAARQGREPELVPNARALATPNAFEAGAWTGVVACRWTDAMESSAKWLGDERFSGRAAIFASWLAGSAFGEFEQAIEFAQMGLRATPASDMLLNNLAYALASLNRVEEAGQVVQRIHDAGSGDLDRLTYEATRGLIAFRSGRPEDGRRLYESAIEAAIAGRSPRHIVAALMHYAREEQRYSHQAAADILNRAEKYSESLAPWEKELSRRIFSGGSKVQR